MAKNKKIDNRIPKAGTKLTHTRGDQTVSCTVGAKRATFKFGRKEYASLSGAAMAAAAKLKLKAKRMNGFVFWGLVPSRAPAK